MEKNQQSAIKFGLAAVLLWSTVATAFKLALAHLSPTQLLFYASLTTWLLLSLILLKQNKLNQILPSFKSAPWRFTQLGLINPALYYMVLFEAYDLLPAQQAQTLNYTWAITLSLLAVPLLGQRLTKFDGLALVLAYFGAAVISTQGNFTELNFTSGLGVCLALASTVLWSFYWIINTKNNADPIVSLFLCFSIGLPVIAVIMTVQNQWQMPSTYGLLSAIYVGLFEMGITFVLWLFALKKATNTSQISMLIFISPFLSLCFIYLFLGEAIHPATIVGLCFIVIGLVSQQVMNKKLQR
ncbi:DMT family transporter [Thalassotalea sp. LPB0316]|uniref:DMT family transporter n=1 Tax=Thalassotalea sp. LPB0316 TaxID=2769490 RepID=UPI0018668A07|nr:DMT family transporter [Thalassotalea sp. LPB0316]QOL24437.1 DMT family transporter [Thalassotalea sp. LPB0316]